MERIEDLFLLPERFFSLTGVWPTKSARVRFFVFCAYVLSFLAMAYADLIDIFGDLELTVTNIVATIVYTISFIMILVIRFSGLLARVIDAARREMLDGNFESDDERSIYLGYNYVCNMFLKISNVGMFVTVVLSYLRPLVNFALSGDTDAMGNNTDVYVLPFRIRTFLRISNTVNYIVVYVYLSPVIYVSMCHMIAICVLFTLVFHICAKLAILAHRIRNIEVHSFGVKDNINVLVESHLEIIWMAKSLDEAFQFVLVDELLGNSIVLAISIYYVLISFDAADTVTCCTFIFYASIALTMLYGYCMVGDQLIQQSMIVQDAYYDCNWQEMPKSCKKSLLICMTRSQIFLRLTAGKFYVFSLGGFTDAQEDLESAAHLISWNRQLLSTLGLWPNRRNNLRFSLTFGYFSLLFFLDYLDLFLFIDNLEHMVINLTETMAFSQIFVRILMPWKYNGELGAVIDEALKDFDERSYKSLQEKKIFILYNGKSKLFVKLLTLFVALTASSYYLTTLLASLGSGGLPRIECGNTSEILYVLLYRFHLFYHIESMRNYVITYAFEMPFVFISGFGQSAADCIMVTLVFHVCGQMAVLAFRINNIDVLNSYDCGRQLRDVVQSHTRLLWMGNTVSEAFNEILLAHLLGATSLVCILGYQILTNFASGEKTILATFLVFQLLVLLTLYSHYIVGECLLTESAKVCEAFYACQWYDMPIENAKFMILCMVRAQKPLSSKAGKFTTFCLSTLTNVLKTSMGYLSVLRSFL